MAAFVFSLCFTSFACNESQTNTYVTQILFGDSALSMAENENAKMLTSALYLCSEQSDNQGQDKRKLLKEKKVPGVPSLSKLNIPGSGLSKCSHNSWEYVYEDAPKNQASRKQVLRNTVNKVFDFGFISNVFGSKGGKCNSFCALLYYSHILADYLDEDPSETETVIDGRSVPPYTGEASINLNGGMPKFTKEQKQSTKSDIIPGDLDDLNRCGAAYAVIGPDSMDFMGPRPKLEDPVAWKNRQYPGIVNGGNLYNRCHLIGRQFCGIDNLHNLITGTRYLNETMGKYETMVANYIQRTGNHVVYKVTPIYKGNNKLASGVQMEASSVEDNGEGICFNVYCYNVQPGIDINYANGENNMTDLFNGLNDYLPFATYSADESNPDLIFEMNKHLSIIFEDQQSSSTFSSMMDEIKSIANEARALEKDNIDNSAQCYVKMKSYHYKYLEVLKSYVPLLLKKEDFFKSAFS